MATAHELRASLDQARDNFRSALAGVNGNWERQPQGGDGEEAWSAKQAAEHAIGWEAGFVRAACDACGYPGPEAPDELAPGQVPDLSLATPQEAMQAFDRAVEASNQHIGRVTDGDLATSHELGYTVEQLLGMAGMHLNAHADQIRSATA